MLMVVCARPQARKEERKREGEGERFILIFLSYCHKRKAIEIIRKADGSQVEMYINKDRGCQAQRLECIYGYLFNSSKSALRAHQTSTCMSTVPPSWPLDVP